MIKIITITACNKCKKTISKTVTNLNTVKADYVITSDGDPKITITDRKNNNYIIPLNGGLCKECVKNFINDINELISKYGLKENN